MSRPFGWYWVKRASEESWQPAYWGPICEYPGELRWRFANFIELHRGRIHRVGPKITEPA